MYINQMPLAIFTKKLSKQFEMELAFSHLAQSHYQILRSLKSNTKPSTIVESLPVTLSTSLLNLGSAYASGILRVHLFIAT